MVNSEEWRETKNTLMVQDGVMQGAPLQLGDKVGAKEPKLSTLSYHSHAFLDRHSPCLYCLPCTPHPYILFSMEGEIHVLEAGLL